MAKASQSSGVVERELRVGDAVTTALLYRAATPSGHGIVLGHGSGSDQRHRFMVQLAETLVARGIDVVTFDFLYVHAGRSFPDKPELLEACWRAALTLARAEFGRVPLIGGKSMGGRIASHLAAAGDEAAGLVLLGYPLHPPKQPDKLRIEHLPRVTLPTLILQGERDEFGTPAELRPYFAGANHELVPMPGGHSYDEKAWPDIFRRVADFTTRAR